MNNPLTLRAAPEAVVRRTFALEDITIRAGGDGRTVEAYASVFDVPATVSDFEGNGYVETIRRGAFERTIAQRGDRMQVIYNHGLDIYGTPAAEFSMPVGVALEMREDARGLFTVTRYSKTPLADQILELIKDGAIRAQSWGGRWVRSDKAAPYRAGQAVVRFEAAMREYGPTPFPVFQDAAILGVRSVPTLAAELVSLSPEERAELAQLISGTPNPDPAATGTASTDSPTNGTDSESQPAATTPADPTPELELRKRQLALSKETQ